MRVELLLTCCTMPIAPACGMRLRCVETVVRCHPDTLYRSSLFWFWLFCCLRLAGRKLRAIHRVCRSKLSVSWSVHICLWDSAPPSRPQLKSEIQLHYLCLS